MIKLLPAPIRPRILWYMGPPYTNWYRGLCKLFLRVKRVLGTKKAKYKLAAILDLAIICAIILTGRQPAQRLVSPMVSNVKTFYERALRHTANESFAFVPDLARNKFPKVDLEGLDNLAFFDVPLTEEGAINRDSRGYASFISEEAAELFDRARYRNSKIFLTLSALDNERILNILDDSEAQTNLADEAADEIQSSNIDGIVVDFESQSDLSRYQAKFTDFISLLVSRIKSSSPSALVAVAVPASSNRSLYHLENLAEASDRIFLIASNFIVPESRNSMPINPVYGYQGGDYKNTISSLLSELTQSIPFSKLALERAWYGNGDRYPLYVPQGSPDPESYTVPRSVELDRQIVDRLADGVPEKGKEAARRNIPLIAKALADESILDSNVLAYALATVEHETDETFEPVREIQGPINARRLGYEGGSNYYGRGFIQITHLRNYRKIGERIGLGEELAKNPDLALEPEISAKILAAFFKDNNVANLASRGQFVAARRPINPDYNGYSVAWLAYKYEL